MKYIFPKRIVALQNVDNADALLKEKTLQIGLSESDCACFKTNSYIILDFGEEVSGGVRILTFGANEHRNLRLRFGESVSETCATVGRQA